MEEYFRDYDNIEHISPVLEITHALGRLSLHYGNTAIFSFAEPYKFLTSVFHNDSEQGVMNFYDSDDLIVQLREHQFPEYFEPLPDEKTVQEYFDYQSAVLEEELREIGDE
jgi:hypothetical protein